MFIRYCTEGTENFLLCQRHERNSGSPSWTKKKFYPHILDPISISTLKRRIFVAHDSSGFFLSLCVLVKDNSFHFIAPCTNTVPQSVQGSYCLLGASQFCSLALAKSLWTMLQRLQKLHLFCHSVPSPCIKILWNSPEYA